MKGKKLAIFGLLTLGFLACGPGRGAALETVQAEEKKYVALTFDDGPRADTTKRLLDGLQERNARATFFLIGHQIEGNEDLVCRMQAEGHQVGNHTWDHVKLQGASQTVVEEQLGKTDTVLQQTLGEGVYWVRPPYGLLNEAQRPLFSTPLIHWSVDPEDWRLRNAPKVVAKVLKTVKPGDIVLLHDFYPSSVEAALQIVDTLKEKGYEFVTVEELFSIYGVEPQPGVFYTDARGGVRVKAAGP